MGRLRSIIAAALFAAIVVLGTGCSGDGFWKRKSEWKVPEMNAPMPGGSPSGGAGVVQASGSSPFAGVPSALARLDPKNDKFVKGNATSIAVAWQNKIDHLPDPARNGAEGPGLAGQIFLFGSRVKPCSPMELLPSNSSTRRRDPQHSGLQARTLAIQQKAC